MTNLRWEHMFPVTLGLETFFHRLDALQDNKGNYPHNIVTTGDETQGARDCSWRIHP